MEITLNVSILFAFACSNFLAGLVLGHLIGKFKERRAWNSLIDQGGHSEAEERVET